MSEKILAGRYEIIEKIGDGGMAVVYKSRDRLLNRFVALKVLRPEYTRDATFVDSFRKESQAAAKLSHPNIVNVYDVGSEKNVHYIVMELVEGKTLSAMIEDEGPLDYKRSINIAKQIASAISHAHKNNIIHRDVKPHNILIMPGDTAKITDFGIAKAVTDATIVGRSNEMVMGSVHYFSPEQARGGYVDEKSDIYSLGIVLYEMLTGRVPFDADNPVTVAVMHMNDRLTPPSQLAPGIPPSLDQIVVKAAEKYQVNRFKTADEMYEALDNVNFITGIFENPVVAELFRRNSVAGSGKDREDAGRRGEDAGRRGEDADADREKRKMKRDKKKNGNEKKEEKFIKLRIIAITLALICALPVSFLIFSIVQGIGGTDTVTVPDLQGMTEEEAESALKELNLELEISNTVTSYDFEEGLIASQEPRPESTVKEGYKVKVNISRGRLAATASAVPNLEGKSLDDAVYELEWYKYVRGSVSYEANALPKDYVIRQTPAAGTESPEGSRINLVLSNGEDPAIPKKLPVPNLIELTADSAKKELESAGFKLGNVEEEPNSAYGVGKIFWQEYSGGTEMDEGIEIDVKISSGPEASAEPGSVSINLNYSQAAEEVFTLTVSLVDASGSKHDVIHEALRYKSSGGETVKVTGEGSGTIYVYFSGVQIMMYVADFDSGTVR